MNSQALLSLAATHLWQVTLLVLVVAMLVRFFAKNRPHLAMALWLLVLVKCVTPPIMSAPFGVFCRTLVAEAPQARPENGPTGVFSRLEPEPAIDADSGVALEPIQLVAAAEPETTLALPDYVLRTWLLGVTLVGFVSLVRVLRCLMRLHRTRVETPVGLEETVQRLRTKLGIRRRVSLIITSSPIGPAVIGLFRSRIVIPEMIARDESASLEPILAHELIHIRRGDLWVGLLDLLTRVLWWFHPLIWWVSKQVVRDTERACDEEVLAEIGCRPADYARSLLRVLEQKTSLRAVPSFPGVRPVEITSQRMERIMSLRQGSRNRSNWRCRLLVVIGAAITLPGAVSSQEAPAVFKAAPSDKSPILIKATLVTAPYAKVAELLGPEPEQARDGKLGVEIAVSGIDIEGRLQVQPTATATRKALEPRNVVGFGFAVPVSPQKPAEPIATSLIPEGQSSRVIGARGAANLVAELRKCKDVEILCAPRMLTRSGSTGSLSTVESIQNGSPAGTIQNGNPAVADAFTLITLRCTPTALDNKVSLAMDCELTTHQPFKKDPTRLDKTVRRMSTKAGLQANQALLTSIPASDGRVTLLLLEANSVLPSPLNIQTAINMAPAARGTSTAPQQVLIRALILEGKRDAILALPEDGRTSETPIIETVETASGPVAAAGAAPTVTMLAATMTGPALQRILRDDWKTLSRPRIMTMVGQEATVEVGQRLDRNNKDSFAGIRLSLTPRLQDGVLSVGGSMLVREVDESGLTRTFRAVPVGVGEATVIRFDARKSHVLCLEATAVNSVPESPRRLADSRYRLLQAAHMSAGPVDDKKLTSVYPVEDLALNSEKTPTAAMQSLQQRIEKIVNPGIWNGERGSITTDTKTRSFIIRADSRTHEQIRELLDLLRRQRKMSGLETRTYPIADLVVPRGVTGDRNLTVAWAELKGLIQSTIEPGSWKGAGGDGALHFSKQHLAMIVSNVESVHEQIHPLLKQLRSLREKQVCLEVSIGDYPDTSQDAAITADGKRLTTRNVSLVARDLKLTGTLTRGPNLTMFSGGSGQFSLPTKSGPLPLNLSATVDAKGRSQVTLTAGGNAHSWVIPDGHTCVGDITIAARAVLGEKAKGRIFTLVIKATLPKIEEEEELILDFNRSVSTNR